VKVVPSRFILLVAVPPSISRRLQFIRCTQRPAGPKCIEAPDPPAATRTDAITQRLPRLDPHEFVAGRAAADSRRGRVGGRRRADASRRLYAGPEQLTQGVHRVEEHGLGLPDDPLNPKPACRERRVAKGGSRPTWTSSSFSRGSWRFSWVSPIFRRIARAAYEARMLRQSDHHIPYCDPASREVASPRTQIPVPFPPESANFGLVTEFFRCDGREVDATPRIRLAVRDCRLIGLNFP
jgi:hypothetical protein